MPSSSNRNGLSSAEPSESRSANSVGCSGAAVAKTPCDAPVRVIDSNLLRANSLIGTLFSSARSMMSPRIGASSRSPAKTTSRVRRVPANSSSLTA